MTESLNPALREQIDSGLDAGARARIDGLFDPAERVPAAYRGCLVCRELFERLGPAAPGVFGSASITV